MPHTLGNYNQDRPFTDGFFVFGPEEIIGLAAADCVLTRGAAGDYNYTTGASKTVTYALQLGKVLRRLGYALAAKAMMEQFGGSQIVASDPLANPVAKTGAVYGIDSGVGLATTGVPRVVPVPKGIKINGFKISYDPGNVIDLVAHTCRMDQIVYADGVANAVTSILASGANGLVLTKRATPYVATVNLAAGSQIFRTTDLSNLTFEIGAQTGVGGQYKMQAIEVLVDFNYN